MIYHLFDKMLLCENIQWMKLDELTLTANHKVFPSNKGVCRSGKISLRFFIFLDEMISDSQTDQYN